MNPIEMIKDDHRRVEQLFEQFREERDRDQKQQIAQQIFDELDVHATLEEEMFYPTMRTAADAQGKEMVAEAYEEHAQVKTMIQQLRGMDADDGQFTSMMRDLIKDVQHHVKEEEDEMLPQAQELLRDQLDRLGEDMTQRKQQLMASMQATR